MKTPEQQQPSDLVGILVDLQSQINKQQERIDSLESVVIKLLQRDYKQNYHISSEQIENVTTLVERNIDQRLKRRMQAVRKVNTNV